MRILIAGVIGGLVMFMWGAVAHMMLPIGEMGMKLPTEPELQFEPEANASYDLSARVLNSSKGSGVTKFGVVGNERYASFAKEPGA